jgi:hypothetical protein
VPVNLVSTNGVDSLVNSEKIAAHLVQAFSRKFIHKVLHTVTTPAPRSELILSALLFSRLILSEGSIPMLILLTHLNRFPGQICLVLLRGRGMSSQSTTCRLLLVSGGRTRPLQSTYPLLRSGVGWIFYVQVFCFFCSDILRIFCPF